MKRALAVGLALTAACRPTPEADEGLDDALVTAFRDMLDPDEVHVAAVLRNLEARIYRGMDPGGRNLEVRSTSPSQLTEEDVARTVRRPDRDPSLTLSVAVGGLSPFTVEQHAFIPTMDDQKPVEPGSPDFYERTFLSDKTCWGEEGCEVLATFQDLTKDYPLGIPPITYAFFKDFRWVDMNAGLPDAEPRMAFVGSSYNDDTYSSENGKNTLWQSYTVELWIPRDGRGFRWEDFEPSEGDEQPEVDWETDSDGEGTLRLLCLWSEADVGPATTETIEKGTIRWGADQNFQAQDDFLATQFPDVVE